MNKHNIDSSSKAAVKQTNEKLKEVCLDLRNKLYPEQPDIVKTHFSTERIRSATLDEILEKTFTPVIKSSAIIEENHSTKEYSFATELWLMTIGAAIDCANLASMFFVNKPVSRPPNILRSLYVKRLNELEEKTFFKISTKFILECAAISRLLVCNTLINKSFFFLTGSEVLPSEPTWLKNTQVYQSVTRGLNYLGNLPTGIKGVTIKDAVDKIAWLHKEFISKILFSSTTRKTIACGMAAAGLAIAAGAATGGVGLAAYAFTGIVTKIIYTAYWDHRKRKSVDSLNHEYSMLKKYTNAKTKINEILLANPILKKSLNLKEEKTISDINSQLTKILKDNPQLKSVFKMLNLEAIEFKSYKKQVMFTQALKALVAHNDNLPEGKKLWEGNNIIADKTKYIFQEEYIKQFNFYKQEKFKQKHDLNLAEGSGGAFIQQSWGLLVDLGSALQTHDFSSYQTIATDLCMILTGGLSSTFIDQVQKNIMLSEITKLRMDGPDYEISLNRYGKEIEDTSKDQLTRLTLNKEVERLSLENIAEQIKTQNLSEKEIQHLYQNTKDEMLSKILTEQADSFNQTTLIPQATSSKLWNILKGMAYSLNPWALNNEYMISEKNNKKEVIDLPSSPQEREFKDINQKLILIPDKIEKITKECDIVISNKPHSTSHQKIAIKHDLTKISIPLKKHLKLSDDQEHHKSHHKHFHRRHRDSIKVDNSNIKHRSD